ncbi:MAG: hypothetical protein QNJ84_05170 [Alphaproteobacteria bacterium]|nr:hypothetical protein [Alphaproteobacteria bacterium]
MALAACQTTTTTVEETPATVELGAVDKVIYPVGTVQDFRNKDGATDREALLSRENGLERWTNETTGCGWTNAGPITAAQSWENCGDFSDGVQEITQDGSLWPLTLGAKATYQLTGSNQAGDTWEDTRRCEVQAASNITVPSGSYDAYKVVCVGGSSARTWFYAPEVGTVAYSWFRTGKGMEHDIKHVATILPPSS